MRPSDQRGNGMKIEPNAFSQRLPSFIKATPGITAAPARRAIKVTGTTSVKKSPVSLISFGCAIHNAALRANPTAHRKCSCRGVKFIFATDQRSKFLEVATTPSKPKNPERRKGQWQTIAENGNWIGEPGSRSATRHSGRPRPRKSRENLPSRSDSPECREGDQCGAERKLLARRSEWLQP